MPKLFVIPASDVDSAIVVRRGPKSWHHLISWNTRDDIFTHGAWIKGTIHCERCDLSPNGQLFLYSIFHPRAARTELTSAYTAISRPPWLYAIAVQPCGTMYGGGGRFLTDNTLTTGPFYSFSPKTGQLGHKIRCLKIEYSNTNYREIAVEVPGADWSGRDRRGRVIFTRGGGLFRRNKSVDELVGDFREQVLNPQPSPPWARVKLR